MAVRFAAICIVTAIAAAACNENTAQSDLPEPLVPITASQTTVTDLLWCLEGKAVLISAHRGGPVPGYPENAIETFAHTIARAPMLIETDVRRTQDGVLVLLHDETLDRTTMGRGLLADQNYDDVRDLRLLDNDGQLTDFHIPRLVDALSWARNRAILLLDVKRGIPIADVVDEVVAADALGNAAIITYSWGQVRRALKADGRITLSASITSAADLETYENWGNGRDRIYAWTGIEEPAATIWQTLERESVPMSFGTLGRTDRAIARSGDDDAYSRLADEGIDVIATDRHRQAFAALEKRQHMKTEIETCLRP